MRIGKLKIEFQLNNLLKNKPDTKNRRVSFGIWFSKSIGYGNSKLKVNKYFIGIQLFTIEFEFSLVYDEITPKNQ